MQTACLSRCGERVIDGSAMNFSSKGRGSVVNGRAISLHSRFYSASRAVYSLAVHEFSYLCETVLLRLFTVEND